MPSSSPNSLRDWIVIGHPGSRRVVAFEAAVERTGAGRVRVVPYQRLLREGIPGPPRPGSLVRIESPGGDCDVARGLLRAGIEGMATASRTPVLEDEINRLEFGRGEILHPRQWMYGFEAVLDQLQNAWGDADLEWMCTPGSVSLAFDKLACLRKWEQAALPTPFRWDGIQTYCQLRAAIPARHDRVFVKLRHGYSAMGAVALEWRGDRVRAITTVESTWAGGRPRLFVTKRPRVLLREMEISLLIDTLAMEDILVEEWLPKARFNGRPYDLRLVCVNGQVCHVVGRARHSPFTNLNLDAIRIGREQIAQALGDSWDNVERLAAAAASEIRGALCLGIDLLVRPDRRRFSVLEANSFGDYLPGLLFRGETTCEVQVRAMQQRLSQLTGVGA